MQNMRTMDFDGIEVGVDTQNMMTMEVEAKSKVA